MQKGGPDPVWMLRTCGRCIYIYFQRMPVLVCRYTCRFIIAASQMQTKRKRRATHYVKSVSRRDCTELCQGPADPPTLLETDSCAKSLGRKIGEIALRTAQQQQVLSLSMQLEPLILRTTQNITLHLSGRGCVERAKTQRKQLDICPVCSHCCRAVKVSSDGSKPCGPVTNAPGLPLPPVFR